MDVQEEHSDCDWVHTVNSTVGQCQFVKETADCHQDEAFIPYVTFVYCSAGAPYSSLIALVFWLVLLFIVLGMTADDFLCPALVVVSKTLRLSESLAGVTLLAFGNGAPDIISSISGIQQARPSLVVGELFGGGTFVTTVVAGLVFFFCRFEIDQGMFVRNVIFYLAASFWTFYLFYEGEIRLGHAIGFLGLYVGYIALVLVEQCKGSCHTDTSHVGSQVDNGEKKGNEVRGGEAPGVARTNFLVPPTWSPVLSASTAGSDLSHAINDSEVEGRIARRRSSTSSIHRHHDHAIAAVLQASTETRAAEGGSPIGPRRLALASDAPLTECTPILQDVAACTGEKFEAEQVPWKEFLAQIIPLDAEEWAAKSLLVKAYDILTSLLRFLLILSIPVVDFANDKANWCRPLNALHCITSPLTVCLLLGKANVLVGSVVPLWVIALILGSFLAVAVWFTTGFSVAPRFHSAFGYAGFLVSLIWIYGVAQELLALLRTLGLVAGISDAVLGLTVLAWGNSVGDLVTDVTVARQGLPGMAVAACFGGPLLNLLLGIGIPYTWLLARSASHALAFEYTPLISVLYCGLVASLCISVVVTLITWFRSSRVLGILLMALYTAFLTAAVLVELKVV